jgi:hypothetical protein
MSEWDIREFLAERAYPTTSVKVLLSEQIAFELDAIEQKLATEKDQKIVAKLEKELAAKQKERDEQLFTIHIRAISNRAKEDIQSAALSGVPIERDLYGMDKPENQIQRQRLIEELIFAAYITKIVTPAGAEQVLTPENGRAVVRAFLDNAPKYSVELVDKTIERISGDAEMKKAQALDPNILPES